MVEMATTLRLSPAAPDRPSFACPFRSPSASSSSSSSCGFSSCVLLCPSSLVRPLRLQRRARNTVGARAHQQSLVAEAVRNVREALLQLPPTWGSSLVSNTSIFLLGFPLLRSGLTLPGIASAFVLGTLTWRAFGQPAFLLVVFYFLTGTLVTKVKIQQKEREGIAEKRSGKRGPSSVWGSGAAGFLCASAAIFGLGGPTCFKLWQLGFAASFATKLSDTVSSEIGKAFGKTTYLVTSLELVPRGTEGAISLEGTLAGLGASVAFCALACSVGQITTQVALACIVASQVANLVESYAGATLQDKEGFEWLNNDVVNVVNISLGASVAMIISYILHLA